MLAGQRVQVGQNVRVIGGAVLGHFCHAGHITGVYAGGVELTGGEKIVVWVSLGLAVGVLLIGLDLLSGGRLFGGLPMPAVSVTESEAVADE